MSEEKKSVEVLHCYFCFLCGTQLVEGAMGFVHCTNCHSVFLPTEDPGTGLPTLTCVQEKGKIVKM